MTDQERVQFKILVENNNKWKELHKLQQERSDNQMQLIIFVAVLSMISIIVHIIR